MDFMVMMEVHVRAYPIMHAGLLLSIAVVTDLSAVARR